jgi:hypothetical protein
VFWFGQQGIFTLSCCGLRIHQNFSIGGHDDGASLCDSERNLPLTLSEDSANEVRYTYRVTWEVSAARPLFIIIIP